MLDNYLFPFPAAVGRRLLNVLAESGDEFTDDEAACDVMLDLDKLERGQLKKLHSYDFYAKRWGWSRSRVARAFSGDKSRGKVGWILERAEVLRSGGSKPNHHP